MHDVIVVGAGPSGLNAARILAERGLDVLILESKNEIGKHIVCTGIVGQEAFREFDLSSDSILKEIKKIKLVSPNSNSIIYEHPYPFAYVVDRERFDRILFQEAHSKGADIKLGNEVMDISVENNSINMLTRIEGKNHKKYSAQMAIISTGINYKLHKRLGLGYPKDFLKGVQADLKIGNIDCTHVFVGRDIATGAFAWLVPIGGKTVRLGLMTESDPRRCFGHLINRIYPERVENMEENSVQFKAIAQGLVSKTFGERVLAVGEAAGQVKTSTGGGIYFGLVCSEIAAKVVVRKFKEGCFSAKDLAEYEKLWKKAIQKEILIGYYARRICAKLSNAQIEKMFRIAQNDGILPFIKERGNFDRHSELILLLLKRLPLLKYIKRKRIMD